MSDPMRVVIADDHPPTRAGVRAALEEAGTIVCGEAGSAQDAIELAIEHEPDVCLLDINMPGNGIAAAADISRRVPGVAVVMLTVSRNDDDLFDALKAGASGYLLKDTDPERLPLALEGVLNGEAPLPRNLVAKLVEEFRGRGRRMLALKNTHASLTNREWEVLEMMREGLSTSEIAHRMFISEVTVRTHVSSILKKLRVTSRADALRLLHED